MTEPTTTNAFLIKLGDGATPTEAFAFPCGAKARSISLTNTTGEETVLDCDDPLNAFAPIIRWVESQDTSLNISGLVAKESWPMWRGWVDGGTVKNIRVEMMPSESAVGGYWALPAIATSIELSSEGKGKVAFTASIVGAGARVWTDAA